MQQKTICVFDLDDTLVKTKAKIKVYQKDTGDLLQSLTPDEFNGYVNLNGHLLDFEDFNDLRLLLSGDLIQENVKLLKEYAKKYPVGMITARGHLGSVLEFIYEKKLPIREDLVFVVNDPKEPDEGTVAEKKSRAFEKLIGMGYDHFIYYDDNKDNLDAAKELESKYPVKFELHHVKS
jgi:hypothetical protein